MSEVVVVGSISADVTVYADRLPSPGETVLGRDLSLLLGGKGANQAVAAARFGAPTRMVGCVGEDAFADLVTGSLVEHGVDIGCVRRVPGGTGVAHIRVDASGQNDIVVAPLANEAVLERDVDEALAGVAGGVLLLQLEVPPALTSYAARAGRGAGLTVVLDPAPAVPLDDGVWAFVDLVTPNESEAAALSGVAVTDAGSAVAAAQWFLERGVAHVLVTLGAQGAVLVDASGSTTYPAFLVTAVDTTAAGDAVTGTLGAALALGMSLGDAVRHALAAGALAVTRAGASTSLPGRAEIDALVSDEPVAPA